MAAFWFGTFAMLYAPLRLLLAIRTLEDGWYVVINAYKLTVLEIWRDFNVLSYIACPRYPYIRVYRLYDIGPVVADSPGPVPPPLHLPYSRAITLFQVFLVWSNDQLRKL